VSGPLFELRSPGPIAKANGHTKCGGYLLASGLGG